MSSEVSIKQLPQITEINNGDLILVQTPNSTNTLLFENFVIGLENTTFASTVNQNTSNIETLSTDVTTISSVFFQPVIQDQGINNLTNAVNDLSTFNVTISGLTFAFLISSAVGTAV